MSSLSGRLRNRIAVVGLVAIAAACTPIERFHGFIPPAEELETLQVGVTTKDQVITLFGPPIADRALVNNTIYYAASQFRSFGPFAPQEVARRILAIDFDANGVMRNVTNYTLEDGRVVVLDRRVTEDGINDVTFLSQLLGSFGRLDAGTFLNQQ